MTQCVISLLLGIVTGLPLGALCLYRYWIRLTKNPEFRVAFLRGIHDKEPELYHMICSMPPLDSATLEPKNELHS